MRIMTKPFLYERHIPTRLLFYTIITLWTVQSRHVIFTDEKKLNIYGPGGFYFNFHARRKEEICVRSSFNGLFCDGVGSNFLIWIFSIVFIQGRQDSTKYSNLLAQETIKIVYLLGKRKWIFSKKLFKNCLAQRKLKF